MKPHRTFLKRTILTLTFACLLSPIFSQHIISYTLIHSYTMSELEDLFVDFGVPSLIMSPEYEVDAYKVLYNTIGPKGDSTFASGAVFIPRNTTCKLPLMAYQHGTTPSRDNVPSRENAEFTLGVVFSSTGYIMCETDYLGLGDGPGFHPYHHAKSEATAVIDMLRATREIADLEGESYSDQLFLFGYSQGGHATMAAHKEIEEFHSAEFQVTAAAPMSGAYDIDGVQAEVITAPDPYPAPNYLPYILLGYNEAYDLPIDSVEAYFVSPYAEAMDSLFDGYHTGSQIDDFLPSVPSSMLNPDTLLAFQTDSSHWFYSYLTDNDVSDWTPVAPMRMLFCSGDNSVFYVNSIIAYDNFVANGVTNADTIDLGADADHGDCVFPCFYWRKNMV